MGLKQEIFRYSRQEQSIISNWFESKLDQLIDRNVYPDLNALEDIGQKLVTALQRYRVNSKLSTAVIGISGGVDSALTAALFKAAGWTVQGVTLPIHQNEEETERGIDTCHALGIEHKHIDLTKTYDELLKNFTKHDKTLGDPEETLRRGNLRVRLRMMTLYNQASAARGLVASTDNFSELAAGFWTLHGDVGDVAPIQSLSKSWEVPKLADLYGVPEHTVFANPTDGLGISNGDEDQFGFSYLAFDIVLLSLCQEESFDDIKDIIQRLDAPNSDLPLIIDILTRIKRSTFKRFNPFNIAHPLDANRYRGLANIDLALGR